MSATTQHQFNLRLARIKAISIQHTLVKLGMLREASLVLAFIREGKIKLYNSDTDWFVGDLLASSGYADHQDREGRFGTYYLRLVK